MRAGGHQRRHEEAGSPVVAALHQVEADARSAAPRPPGQREGVDGALERRAQRVQAQVVERTVELAHQAALARRRHAVDADFAAPRRDRRRAADRDDLRAVTGVGERARHAPQVGVEAAAGLVVRELRRDEGDAQRHDSAGEGTPRGAALGQRRRRRGRAAERGLEHVAEALGQRVRVVLFADQLCVEASRAADGREIRLAPRERVRERRRVARDDHAVHAGDDQVASGRAIACDRKRAARHALEQRARTPRIRARDGDHVHLPQQRGARALAATRVAALEREAVAAGRRDDLARAVLGVVRVADPADPQGAAARATHRAEAAQVDAPRHVQHARMPLAQRREQRARRRRPQHGAAAPADVLGVLGRLGQLRQLVHDALGRQRHVLARASGAREDVEQVDVRRVERVRGRARCGRRSGTRGAPPARGRAGRTGALGPTDQERHARAGVGSPHARSDLRLRSALIGRPAREAESPGIQDSAAISPICCLPPRPWRAIGEAME